MGFLTRHLRTLVARPPLKRVYLGAIRLRFRLWQRWRGERPVLEQVAGFPIVVLPQVLNPRLFYSGEFLARTLDSSLVPVGGRVLDMGTGSGIIAVAAAHLGAQVVAVDINPIAVRAARVNALLNAVEGVVEAREGDLFEAVQGDRFDVVIFNPPYLPGEPRSQFERALYSADVVQRFGANLAAHLAPQGYALVLLSSLADERQFLNAFAAQGLEASVVAERSLINETMTIYRLAPSVERTR